MISFIALFIPFLTAVVANDWNAPCFDGECQYSLPSSSGAPSGTVKIWGSAGSISDITAAAGWEIIGCSPDALAHDIRLVCIGDNAKCNHLYQSVGAEGKIVRLPENCGKSAFARVAKAWIAEDQSIPSSIASRLVHRDVQPQVHALALDTNFGAIDTSKSGTVRIAVRALHTPAVDAETGSPVFGRQDVPINNALANGFNITNTTALQPVDVDQPFNVFDQSLSCPPATANLKVDVDAKAHAEISLGVSMTGTLVPPKFDDFSLLIGLTADLNGTVDLNADVAGTVDSGKIPIFQIGIPGLSFPGILDIGPSLEIDVQAKATLDLNLDLAVGLNYNIKNAQLLFPPNNATAPPGDFKIADTPLKISASPDVKSTGSVEAHIIPTIKLGISALGGIVDTSVFLSLDASATLILTLEAQAGAVKAVKRANSAKLLAARSYNPPAIEMSMETSTSTSMTPTTTSMMPPTTTRIDGTCLCVLSPQSSVVSAIVSTKTAMTTATSSFATTTATSQIIMSSAASTTTASASQASSSGSVGSTDVNGSFGGCFEVKAGLDVTAGADAAFFNFFDQNTQVTLFQQNFEIFKKCFGAQATKRASRRSRLEEAAIEKRAGLACPDAGVGTPVAVTDQQVPAASIQAIP